MDRAIFRSGAFSLVVHAGAVILLLALSVSVEVRERRRPVAAVTRLISPFVPRRVAARGGAGPAAEPAVQKGAAPKRASRVFVAPVVEQPKLPLEVSVDDTGPVIAASVAAFGDPLGSALQGGGSALPGFGGTGKTGPAGLMSGEGTDRVYRVGSGVTAPAVLHRVEPEFSEEARKAKYSGSVMLRIEVDATGHARNIRVVRSAGMGLDEKAIEAVSKWVFRPGTVNGKPVTVAAQVEVAFHLL